MALKKLYLHITRGVEKTFAISMLSPDIKYFEYKIYEPGGLGVHPTY
jgi:hypothetical protein